MIDLQRKVGPLPIWAYGAVAGGGALILFLRARSKSGAASPTAGDMTAAQDGYQGPWTGSDPGGPGSSSYGVDNGSNPQQSPQGTGYGTALTSLVSKPGIEYVWDPVRKVIRATRVPLPKVGPGQRASWDGTKYVIQSAVHAPLRPAGTPITPAKK